MCSSSKNDDFELVSIVIHYTIFTERAERTYVLYMMRRIEAKSKYWFFFFYTIVNNTKKKKNGIYGQFITQQITSLRAELSKHIEVQ